MKLILLCLIFFVSVCTFAQDSLQQKVLTSHEMLEDLEVYKKLLTETHPGLYRYQTETDFNAQIDNIRSQLTEPLPFYTFYRLMARLSADVRCAHTQLFPQKDVLAFVKESCNLFPLFVYPVDDKLYVLLNGTEDQSIKPGFEIVTINGKSVSEITDVLKQYYFRDGNSTQVIRRFLQGGYFSMFYYFFVEQPSQFDIEFRDLEGSLVTYQIKAQPYGITNRNYSSKEVNKKMMSYYGRKRKLWEFKILEEVNSTAYMRFASFGGKGMSTEAKAQKGMQEFMNSALKTMERRGIENLVVELRSNSGGWDIQGVELFTYLLKSDESKLYYKDQFAVTKDSEFLKYSDLSPEDIKQADKYLIPLDDGTFRLNPEGTITLKPQVPKKNRFKGNVYILVDEQCSSSCAEFVAAAKSNGIGILVGNESGGAYEGGNGSTFIQYQLPNSHIFSNTPLAKYEMSVQPVAEPGRGTVPHYRVMPTIEDILHGRDAQKEFVYQLIRKGEK